MSSDNSKDSLMNNIHGNDISKFDEELAIATYGNMEKEVPINLSETFNEEMMEEIDQLEKLLQENSSIVGIRNFAEESLPKELSRNDANGNLIGNNNSTIPYFDYEWNEWTPHRPPMDVDWNINNLVTSTPKKNQEFPSKIMHPIEFLKDSFLIASGELLRFPREKILVPENPFDLEYYISKVKKGLKLDDVKSTATAKIPQIPSLTMIGESFENMGPNETIAVKVVRCELCKAEYPENYIELHLFGVHGVSGPKEFYTNQKGQIPSHTMTSVSLECKVPIETISAKVVRCEFCKEEYPENHIERHYVGVHGVSDPKETYINQEDSNVVAEVYGNWERPIKNLPLSKNYVTSDGDFGNIIPVDADNSGSMFADDEMEQDDDSSLEEFHGFTDAEIKEQQKIADARRLKIDGPDGYIYDLCKPFAPGIYPFPSEVNENPSKPKKFNFRPKRNWMEKFQE